MVNRVSTESLTQSSCVLPAKGYWFPPMLLTDVTHAHRVASENVFGSVLRMMTFRMLEKTFERNNGFLSLLLACARLTGVLFRKRVALFLHPWR